MAPPGTVGQSADIAGRASSKRLAWGVRGKIHVMPWQSVDPVNLCMARVLLLVSSSSRQYCACNRFMQTFLK